MRGTGIPAPVPPPLSRRSLKQHGAFVTAINVPPQLERRKLLRQRRSDVALLYHEWQEVERGCRAPIVLTSELIAAGVTEDKARRANERRRLDARQQYETAVRRVNIMTQFAVRRAHPPRPSIEPQRRRQECRRPRQRRSHRTIRRATADTGGDSDPEPPRPRARGPPPRAWRSRVLRSVLPGDSSAGEHGLSSPARRAGASRHATRRYHAHRGPGQVTSFEGKRMSSHLDFVSPQVIRLRRWRVVATRL
jgi:hypothetical protein